MVMGSGLFGILSNEKLEMRNEKCWSGAQFIKRRYFL